MPSVLYYAVQYLHTTIALARLSASYIIIDRESADFKIHCPTICGQDKAS